MFSHYRFPMGSLIGANEFQGLVKALSENLLGNPFALLARSLAATPAISKIHGDDDPFLLFESGGMRAMPDPSRRPIEIHQDQVTGIGVL